MKRKLARIFANIRERLLIWLSRRHAGGVFYINGPESLPPPLSKEEEQQVMQDILAGRVGEYGRALLEGLDVLVDGPFVEARKDLTLRFRGSANQRIIDVPASLRMGQAVLRPEME